MNRKHIIASIINAIIGFILSVILVALFVKYIYLPLCVFCQ